MPARLPPRPAPSVGRGTAWRATLALALACTGCALQRYEPRPLDPAALQAQALAAGSEDAALREALAAQGIDVRRWPLTAWDLPALTALALQRHPDMALARAELRGSETARRVARERAGRGAELTLEHHSADGASASPWSLGLVFDAFFTGAPRRAAQADEADALADAAVAQAAQTAWQLRQRVRSAWLGCHTTAQRTAAADAAWQAQRDLAAAQQTRLARGAADGRELQLARQAEAEAAQQAGAAHHAAARARLALAAATGLPAEAAAALPLAFDALDAEPPLPPTLELQRAALLNRLDLRAALAQHAAADAALRVELAKQWPELALRPGFAWDQGDRIASLGLALTLPPGGHNAAAIEQARAQRDVQAARVDLLQRDALAALDTTRLATEAAQAEQAAAQDRRQASLQRLARTERQLAAGDADRLALLAARAAEAEARLRWIDARAARWAALGALEDAVQQPLDTPPPAPAAPRPAPP